MPMQHTRRQQQQAVRPLLPHLDDLAVLPKQRVQLLFAHGQWHVREKELPVVLRP